MTQKLMISYSRSQTPFVNRFYQELAEAGYSIWLDYRSIVPARPWLDQIQEGIAWADTVLLVVSRESMISDHVREEWSLALKEGKRLILVMFDAVDLSPCEELRKQEWVDFRLQHRKSLERLKDLLDGKVPLEKSSKRKSQAWGKDMPPEKGFRASLTFWLAFLLSFLVVVSSLLTWWTIFIPYVLAPLPLQIYKRNYSLSRVLPALLFMPVVWLFTYVTITDAGNILRSFGNVSDMTVFFVAVYSWLLLALLLTPAMQRRARPEAAFIHFARSRVQGQVQGSGEVTFIIEHAPEDGRCAEYLRNGLVSQGYREAQAAESPNAVFVLISSYNKRTVHDPEKVPVFPVLLQAAKDLEKNLARIQWIDFRRGIRNTNKLARLLQNPTELLKEVAIAPTGNQEIFPLVVNALQYFYLITGILGGGGLLIYLASYTQLLLQHQIPLDAGEAVRIVLMVVQGILLFGAVLYCVRPLRLRQGGSAGGYPLLFLTIVQAVFFLSFLLVIFAKDNPSQLVIEAGNQLIMAALVFPMGLVLVLPFLLLRWGELYRWLPRHTHEPADRIEKALLLYTPARRSMLVYHILFHGSLVLAYLLLLALTMWPDMQVAGCIFLPLLLVVAGLRWLAWRAARKSNTALAAKPG